MHVRSVTERIVKTVAAICFVVSFFTFAIAGAIAPNSPITNVALWATIAWGVIGALTSAIWPKYPLSGN